MGEIGFKGFEKGLVCKEKQYAENTVFEEPEAILCKCGMHYCKTPLDVLDYYPLIDGNGNLTEFATVEPLAEEKTDDNKKFCTTKLKVCAKLSIFDFIKLSAEVLHEKISRDAREATENTENSGDWAQLAAGNRAQLAAGNWAQLAAGNDAQLAAGNRAQLAAGENSVMVGDNGSIAKSMKGSVIVLVERDDDYNIISYKAEQVDGERIKEDTWYKIENGEFVEVTNG